MATLGAGVPTLLDVVKLFGNDGKELRVAEVLNTRQGMLEDMTWVEGTDSDGMQTAIRTGIPTPTWRRFNEGVQPSKATQVQVKFTTAQMEAVSNVDVDLASKYADPSVYRANQDKAQIEGMAKEAARALIEDNESTSPGKITGLNAFYASLSAESGDNIIDAGGTGSDNTSIWVVCWSPDCITGIYPKGSKAGLSVKNMGEILVADATGIAGASYLAYQTRFKWQLGLAVADWRQAVRVCNIDHSNLVTNSSAADLVKLLSRAVDAIEDPGKGRMGIYMRKDVMAVLNEQARASVSTGGGISYETVDGKPVTMWRGIPIRRCDALGKAEARVT